MSDSLRPHELQHAGPPCPSPTPRVYSNSCPSSWWCHPAISSSVVPFSSCPQSLPASGSFPMSQLSRIRWPKYWSFSFSISPSNEHPGLISFRMDWLEVSIIPCLLMGKLRRGSGTTKISNLATLVPAPCTKSLLFSVQLLMAPWAHGFPVLHRLPEFAQIQSWWCYRPIIIYCSVFKSSKPSS